MRERRTPGGIFSRTLHFSEREIDQLCSEALKKSGFYPADPSPVDIESFVERHFETQLDMGTNMGDGVLGWTLFDKSGRILLVGVSSDLAGDTSWVGMCRCRATVAHEAGHCLMHPSLFMDEGGDGMFGNVDLKHRRILCRKEDFSGKYDGRWWEVQANRAIGGLLLPKPLVQRSIENLLVASSGLGLPTLPEEKRDEAISRISETFEVNKKPAEIRLLSLFPAGDTGLL